MESIVHGDNCLHIPASKKRAWLERFERLPIPLRFEIESLGELKYGENVFRHISPAKTPFEKNCHLSIGLPDTSFVNSFATRFAFFAPWGLPQGRSVCITSSRIGRKPDIHDSWFDGLRTATIKLRNNGGFLVSAASSVTDQFLPRVAQLFQIPLMSVQPWKRDNRHILHTIPKLTGCYPCWYIPLDDTETADAKPSYPVQVDSVAVAIARETIALSVRDNGNIERAVGQRLRQSGKPLTRILLDKSLTSASTLEKLVSLGAVKWWLRDDKTIGDGDERHSQEDEMPLTPIDTPLLKLDEIDAETYFLHWTRRRHGPWPNQTQEQFIDDLIFRTSEKNHSEIAALTRILVTQRLLATNRLTRSDQKVVCFSEMGLDNVKSERRFRSHLGRWDVQPYGIAIDKAALKKMGAKKVIYGGDATWDKLPDRDRPYFQLARSRSGQIDWRKEKEWRLVGDLDLASIDSQSALVFVETLNDAVAISPFSRWPVVILQPN